MISRTEGTLKEVVLYIRGMTGYFSGANSFIYFFCLPRVALLLGVGT